MPLLLFLSFPTPRVELVRSQAEVATVVRFPSGRFWNDRFPACPGPGRSELSPVTPFRRSILTGALPLLGRAEGPAPAAEAPRSAPSPPGASIRRSSCCRTGHL